VSIPEHIHVHIHLISGGKEYKLKPLGVTGPIEDAEILNVSGSKIIAGTLPYTSLESNAVQVTVDIPILMSSESAAADAVGTPIFSHSTIKLDTETIKHLKSAKLIIDYDWPATAVGTIQLYDSTAAAVLAESTEKSGGESSEWEEIAVTGTLTAGNTIVLRANITSAGGTGEAVTIYRAILRLVLGVS